MKFYIYLSLFLFNSIVFGQKIDWKTMEEADSIQLKNPNKKIFVDIYTTWCGPCKMLDAQTFSDPEFATFINKNYIPVKLNAEGKEDIKFKGNTWKYISVGRRGYHELAAAILDGRMSFPTMLVINSDMEIQENIKGFYEAKPLLKYLKSKVTSQVIVEKKDISQ